MDRHPKHEVFMICQGRLFNPLMITLVLVLSACGNGRPGWGKFPVTIYSDATITTYPQAQSDLQDAMNFWEQQSGQKIFDYRGTYNGTPYTGDVQHPSSIVANTIFFQSPWPLASAVVGQTIVNSTSSNQIQSAMVMINGNAAFCWGDCIGQYNQTSARKTFTHELGHFIGLAHTQDNTDIMYPQITPGGSLTTVRVDSAALRELTLQ
jgi:hypothetical protein